MLPMLHITGLLAVPTEELVEAAKADPVLLGVLIGVGVLAALFFVFGIIKQFFKTAVFAGLLSAGVWYWYFNIR